MKIRFALGIMIFFAASTLYGQISDNCVTHTLLSAYSEKVYSFEPVTDEQLNLILASGIKAPSSHNKQPWKFTVIKDTTLMVEILDDVTSGNVLIVVAGLESENGTIPAFDCGLATENMFIAAHGLGLGARIYSSPARNINSKKDHFQIPFGYQAVVVLRIGNVDESVDASTAATPRNLPGEVINYYKR